MQTPLISVVIPTFNYGRFLGDAIRSVLRQTYDNIEVLVVDDGSTDETPEVVSEFTNLITYIWQQNAGQSVARNIGIYESKGSLIAFLDADDFWEPSKIQMQYELLSDKCGFIYCGARTFQSYSNETINVLDPLFRGNCTNEFIKNPGVQIVTAGESSVLVRKDIAERVGGFDKRLSISAGYDFYRRCSNITEFDFVDETLVNYRSHGSNISLNKKLYVSDFRLSVSKMIHDKESQLSLGEKFKLKTKSEAIVLKTKLKKYLS